MDGRKRLPDNSHFVHGQLDSFSSVYVDAIKMAGKKLNATLRYLEW